MTRNIKLHNGPGTVHIGFYWCNGMPVVRFVASYVAYACFRMCTATFKKKNRQDNGVREQKVVHRYV
jgi:hypothetical protein